MSIDILPNGILIANPSDVAELLFREISISAFRVTELNDEIQEFNKISSDKIKQFDQSEQIEICTDWIIPDEYANLNLDEYVLKLINSLPLSDYERGEIRLLNELQEFRARGLENLLKTIIYIVDKFKDLKIVWGVGRGSSCASYLLFKIGLHSVDSLKYNIPASEFFH